MMPLLFLKFVVTLMLLIPTIVLTILIWTLGGWTQGFDHMPNPLYALFDWLEA